MNDQSISNVTDIADARKNREFGFIKKVYKTDGYAFINPDNGGRDVFLSLMEAQHVGIRELSVGMRVSFRRYTTTNGKQRATDVAIVKSPTAQGRDSKSRPTNKLKSPSKRLTAPMPSGWREGTLKFYDPQKGYGFVQLPGEARDAFLSRYTLQASGLDPELRLKMVPARVVIVPGKKQGTIDVFSIQLLV